MRVVMLLVVLMPVVMIAGCNDNAETAMIIAFLP